MAHAHSTWTTTWHPSHLPPRWIWFLLAVVAIGVAATAAYMQGWVGTRQAAVSYQTATAQRGNIVQSVEATGPISAPSTLPLNFKSAGRLAELDVSVGDRVEAGQVLARLDTADLEAQRAQAQANLAQASANYDKAAAGVTAEDVAVAQAQLDAAASALASAQRGLAVAQASATQSVEVA